MTTPGDGDGTMQAQMLIKMNDKLDGLVTDVAVIKNQMSAVPKLEERLRLVENAQASASGGRDTQARITSWAAAAAAVGAGVAGYLHH